MSTAHPNPDRQSPGSSSRFWLLMIVLAGLFLAYTVISRDDGTGLPDGTQHPAVGKPLSQLQLEPLVEAPASVTLEDLRGQVVLVNYWGTWCPPCRIEFPELMDAYSRLKDNQDFRLLSVSCSAGGSESEAQLRAETRQYLEEENYDVPVYSDLSEVSRRGLVDSAQLDGFNFPTTILLDREGVIQGVWIGYHSRVVEQMEKATAALLARKT